MSSQRVQAIEAIMTLTENRQGRYERDELTYINVRAQQEQSHALCRTADALERLTDAMTQETREERTLSRIADALGLIAEHLKPRYLETTPPASSPRDGTHWLCECSAINRVEDESCTVCNVSRIYPRP